MKKVLSALIITLSMATAHAQHCGEPMHERVEHAAMKLDLSKEQRAQIMAIGHESKQKLMPLRARLKEMRHQINETYKTNSMNNFKLHGFIREEKDTVGDMIKIRMEERYKINQLLNEKQRVRFAEMMDHWKKEHHKKMKHHRKDH